MREVRRLPLARRRWARRAALPAAAALLAITGSLVMAQPAPAADPLAEYPLILDVDLTPAPSCSKPVQARVTVYHPEGAKAGAEVEWRMRVGGTAVRTGRVTMNGTTATAEFTVPFAAVPAAADVLVDARVAATGQDATPGPFGKAWRDKLSRSCNPVRVVSIGDSVVWGQGLEHDQKFPRLTAELLGAATGRGFQNLDYSISGAVLDAPELPAGNDDGACLGEQYAQDPDRDGEMEFGEVTQQMPDVFCQLERAKANAEAGGYPVDLVVLNGCINDVDPFFGVGVGITPGSEDLPRAIRRECSGIGAAAENPAKNVPYFSGAKVGYGGRGMQAAIEKAHSLPGNPKVLVADFNYAFSRASIPVMRQYCNTDGLTAEQASRCRQGLGAAADRYEQFTRYSAEAYRQAAQAANAKSPDGPYAVAADGLFTLDNAVLAPEQLVWADPTKDSVYSLRRFACPELSSTPSQCITAAIAHPDVPGARHYAESFLLNPRVRAWFGLPSADGHEAFTTSQSTGPVGLEVTFDASAAAGRRTGSERYQWYFGDGTQLVTDAPTASHAYRGAGPHLPRLVVTDSGGGRTLYEAPEPIVITAPVSGSGG